MRRRIATILIASTLVVVLVGVASAFDGARKPFRSDGDCEQIAAFVPVPIASVRGLVPDSFSITGEETGTAQLLVTGGRCDPWLLGGVEVPPIDFGLVSVLAQPRGQSPSLSGYDLRWFFDDATTFRRWSAIGFETRHVAVEYATTTGPTGITGASLDVPWKGSPFSIDAVVLDAPDPALPFPSQHWHERRHGRIRSDHDNTEGGIDPALLTIQAAPGSPLARMLGAETTTILGGYLTFHHSAVTGLEG